MQACRHAGIQPCRHTGMQLCSHAKLQAYRHAGTQAYKHTGMQACRHTGMQADIHTYIQAYKHAGMQPYKHAGLTPHLTCTSNPQFQISNHKPQAPNLKPKPQAEQKNQQNISKKLQKTIVKSGQKMSKIHKNHKKLKNSKPEIKIRKSLANPIPSKSKSKINTISNKISENQKITKKIK